MNHQLSSIDNSLTLFVVFFSARTLFAPSRLVMIALPRGFVFLFFMFVDGVGPRRPTFLLLSTCHASERNLVSATNHFGVLSFATTEEPPHFFVALSHGALGHAVFMSRDTAYASHHRRVQQAKFVSLAATSANDFSDGT